MDPCCGSSLRRGTKLIAFIDMGLASLQLIFSIMFLFLVILHYNEVKEAFDDDKIDFPQLAQLFDLNLNDLIIIFSLTTFYFIGMFFLAKYLYHGAHKKDYSKLHRWYNITLILLVARIILYLSGLFISKALGAFGVFGIIYQIYCLWIVRAFLNKLSYSNYWEIVGESTSLIYDNNKICGPPRPPPPPKYIHIDNE